MDTERYIVAIEIGSSKIRGAIGTRSLKGVVTVLGVDTEPLNGSVKRGFVVRPDEVSAKIKRLIFKLSNRIGTSKKIKQVYVGISGQSLHAEEHMISRDFPEGTLITEDIIKHLQEEAREMPIAGADILEVVRTEVTVDGRLRTGRDELMGSSLKMGVKLIVARDELKRSAARCFQGGLGVVHYIPTALSTAYVALSNEDRQAGVMLVDFGADTTSVSIYKDGFLRYLSTIPLGGQNITRDIMTLNVTAAEAESFKVRLGSAKVMGDESNITLRGENNSEIKSLDLSKVVKARIEEIVANVNAHFDYAKCDRKSLGAGMVIVGGASKLSNLTELLAEKCDIKVRKGALRQDMLLDVASQSKSSDYLQILGLLYSGRENCVETEASSIDDEEKEPVVEEVPVDPREQKAREKEEQERRKRAEKERRKREVEEAKKREKERKEKEKEEKEKSKGPGLFGKVKDMLRKAETLLDDENDNY
ncbi:MAG TPA: rod shape-determining protein [Candidatus Barnesiella merdipullorum]|nr:rod shape-determining protein [Candidatus Barnesiella merdipullorum]